MEMKIDADITNENIKNENFILAIYKSLNYEEQCASQQSSEHQ